MKRILLFLLALLLTIPALAQDDASAPPAFIVSAHQCNRAGLEALLERDRERAAPLMQALVNEGKLIQAGEAVHQWGDDHNLLTWLAAADISSALDAYEEMTARYTEAHPDDRLFIETCPKHRDYFYTRRGGTQADLPSVSEDNTPTLAVSYYTCDYTKVGDLVEKSRTRGLPIAQALVDEGAMSSEALYTHAWGDEWNLAITRTAKDLPTLLDALDTYGERYEAEYGENPRTLFDEHCSAHKDNIYTIVMVTN